MSQPIAEGCPSMPGPELPTLTGPSAQPVGLVCKDFSPSRAGAHGHVLSQHRAARLHRSHINLHQLRTSPRPSPPALGSSDRGWAQNQRQSQGPSSEGKSCKTPVHLQPHSSAQAAAPRLARECLSHTPAGTWLLQG